MSVNTGLMHSYHNVAKLRQIHGYCRSHPQYAED
jgi:hypothetical protein